MSSLTDAGRADVAPIGAMLGTTLGPVGNDWEAAAVWLEVLRQRGKSANTLRTYELEVRRLRWYVETFAAEPPSRWRFDSFSRYREFLATEAVHYVAVRGSRPGQAGWTPFRGPLAPATVNQACGIVGELFRFWVEAKYLAVDPSLGQTRHRASRVLAAHKSLAAELIQLVMFALDRRERRLAVDHLRYYRDRFLFLLFVRTGLRTAEAALADMADVFRIEDGGEVFWGLTVRHQKGGGDRNVPLDADLMDVLRLYRRAFNLAAEPQPGEEFGLVLSPRTFAAKGQSARSRRFREKWRAVRTRQGIYEIIKGTLEEAAVLAESSGQVADAQRLRNASTHWLRHTRAKEVVYRTKNLRAAAELLGHKDPRTTMRYSRADFIDLARELDAADR